MKRMVLIVDDNMELLLSLKEWLEENESLSILIAGDGLAALEILKKNAVSLVVTDLKMPHMDGLTLLGHILENYPDIPVIIMTVYGTPTMERLAQEGGVAGYIMKP